MHTEKCILSPVLIPMFHSRFAGPWQPLLHYMQQCIKTLKFKVQGSHQSSDALQEFGDVTGKRHLQHVRMQNSDRMVKVTPDLKSIMIL